MRISAGGRLEKMWPNMFGGQCMDQAPDQTSWPRLRVLALVAGVIMLALWAWSLVPAIAAVRDPRGDPFELIPAFWASVTALPLGLITFWSGVRGGEQRLRRARTALIVAAVLCAIVALLEIVRRLSETEVG
jgi:O-antigen/teichoic acid export membrane protein